LSLEICTGTHSLVVDHIGFGIKVWINSILLFFLSIWCSVQSCWVGDKKSDSSSDLSEISDSDSL